MVMISSLVQCVELEVQWLEGILARVEALLLQDPVPLEHSHQPQRGLKGMMELAKAGLPHLGARSTPQQRDLEIVGKG